MCKLTEKKAVNFFSSLNALSIFLNAINGFKESAALSKLTKLHNKGGDRAAIDALVDVVESID